MPGGIHARYDRVNRKTGEVIVTDGIGEYTTAQIKKTGISSGLTEGAMMPPNNTPDPSDLADLLLQSQQHNNNDQPDYSNDTSFLYAKNVSKALLEQALNRIGGKYGASHLISSAGLGKLGRPVSEYTKTNSDIMSTLFAAGADTAVDKRDVEQDKKSVDFNK